MPLCAAIFAVWGTMAGAVTPSQRCEVLINKAAGKRALCTSKERAKEIAGNLFDYAKCSLNMETAFSHAWLNWGGACPSGVGYSTFIEARIDGVFNISTGIPVALSGTRCVDNGDGTVSDTVTGLMWEKKDNLDSTSNLSDPHDADNTYTWSLGGADEAPNGTAYTDFLHRLNDCAFDGEGVFRPQRRRGKPMTRYLRRADGAMRRRGRNPEKLYRAEGSQHPE